MNDHPRPRVTLEQLHTFVAVARREHVRKAAEAIPLSQGAVSQQVRLLERTLGIPLLERAGRGVRLTEAGHDIERAAAAALHAALAVEEIAAGHRGLEQGTLHIAASNTAGVYRLPPWIAGFAEAHPAVGFQLELETTPVAIARLVAGEVELAVVEGPFDDAGLESVVLDREELLLVVAAGHPLTARQRLDVAALRRYRYLSRGRGAATEALARRLVGAGYGEGPVLELGHVDAIRAGVISRLGYAVLPRAVVDRDIARGHITVLRRTSRRVHNEFRAVRRPGPAGPQLRAFWAHLVAVAPAPPRA
ncbi:MAG TPA: LysR family transcriptional regulator [Candidatus Dormibacteraeota bacterium]|nr:LysR family transcriptional regulator [Candidatus Dormibacteraeota bacterium]